MKTFDAGFLQKSKAQGVADAFKPIEDGEYQMICVESEIVPVKGDDTRSNWKISFGFAEGSAEREEYGKRKISTWCNLDESNFPRIAGYFEALYDTDWPDEGLNQEEFTDMVRHAKGRDAIVTVEVVPHWKADTDPQFKDSKQNNILTVRSPLAVEEEEAGFFNLS